MIECRRCGTEMLSEGRCSMPRVELSGELSAVDWVDVETWTCPLCKARCTWDFLADPERTGESPETWVDGEAV